VLIAQEPDLEVLAPVATNIVCFRYNPGGLDDERLNALNSELLIRLHESGIAAPSYTTLQGRYCLRAAIVNYRTTSDDLAVLVQAVREIGAALPRH
jgi:aromatic-L-amino-acid/L-tryptophan decarboxylase